MSIRFLAKSHETHITGTGISVKTQYVMDVDDFMAGFGTLILPDSGSVENFTLPTIGDRYIDYHFDSGLDGCFWESVVLNDITEQRTTGREAGSTLGTEGWGRGTQTILTYTWTNTGAKDYVCPGEATSMKFDIETNTEIIQSDLIINFVTGVQTSAAHEYFTGKNPDVTYYIVGDDGKTTGTVEGSYNSVTDGDRRYHRENNESPTHEVYNTKTILRVTLFSYINFSYLLSDNLSAINNIDFFEVAYNFREAALVAKNKKASDGGNDLITNDDTFKWLFYDYSKEQFGVSGYKYVLYFLYKPDTWKKFFGRDVAEYAEIDFQNTLILPFFA